MTGRPATADRGRLADSTRDGPRGTETIGERPMPEPTETTAFAASPPEPPASAYRAALQRYDQGRLLAIHRHSGGAEVATNHKVRPDWIVDRLAEPRTAERMLAALPAPSRMAMGLFTLSEAHAWSVPRHGAAWP